MARTKRISKTTSPAIKKARPQDVEENLRKLTVKGAEGEDGSDVSLIPAQVTETLDEEDPSAVFIEKTVQGQESRGSFRRNIFLLVLLAIPVIAAYANTLSVPFYLDDSIAISLNPLIRMTEISWDSISRFDLRSRPVAYFTFALNYYFHQYALPGYHIVNIFIHLMSGVFLFFLFRETLNLAAHRHDEQRITAVAFWASLLWLVNPLCTSAVTYVVQRMTSLAAMFYVLALLIYVRGRLAVGIRRLVCYGLSIGVWLLALATKQIAIPLPFVVLLYEILFFQKPDAAWVRRNLKYFVVVVGIMVGLAFLFLGTDPLKAYWEAYEDWEYTPAQRLFTAFRVLVRYLSLFFFPYPDRLIFDYNYPLSNSLLDPVSTLFSMATVAGLLAAAIYLARKQSLFSFAIFWFFGNLLLESVWPTSIIFEHKAYLPTMFMSVPLCDWVVRFVGWRRFSVAGLLIVGLFGLWTYQRNVLWQDPVALWQQSVREYPGKAKSYSGLGDALFRQGKFEEATPYFKEAVRLDPHYPDAFNNLGACLHRQRKYAEAIENFHRALDLNIDYFDAQSNLGMSYLAVGEIDKALYHLRKAFQIDPENAKINGELQSALNYAEAIKRRAGEAKR